ncbi:bifunctional hydroxymethylpyrimidine kinase/phosphomethylpyrimidine kinase [Clostridium sp. SYSU_GA19001]|nr:bifunctional hydroxymethylpyrimidine kinase/phosphomethylpyrimidine kinase [Clostridium caldaquaticum]
MYSALTIAGSDSCGGAGIQADLKSFSAHGVYGMSVITAVTAQNTQGVFAVQDITPELIAQQIDAIFSDIEVHAVKIGMVSKIASIEAISKKLQQYSPKNVVLDPVMISKSGYSLLQPEAKTALIEKLLPLADVLTPNIPEAEAILEEKYKKKFNITNVDEMVLAAKEIHKLGAKYVLIKGGHLEGKAVDVLYDGKSTSFLETERINTKNTHGTGCTLSSSIAANLALGFSVVESVKRSKEYITTAIEQSLEIGKGVGPTNHFYTLYKKAGLNFD